jgi:hypothetical protein
MQLSKTNAQELTISDPLWLDLDEISGEYGLFSTKPYRSADRK